MSSRRTSSGSRASSPDAAGDHGVGHADEHDAVEAQAPGPAEGGHEDPVAETAVGELRGVEARSLRARSARPAGTRRGRCDPTRRRARPARAPPRAPARRRRARRRATTAGVGVEVAVEELDRPRGVGRPRPRRRHRARARGPRRTRPARRPRGPVPGSRAGQVREPFAPLRRAPHHAGVGRQRVPAAGGHPSPVGARDDRGRRQPRHHLVRGPSPTRPARAGRAAPAPVTDRCEASRLGPVGGDAGAGQLLVQGAGVAGAGGMEDRLGPRRHPGVDRRAPRSRTAARTSSSGSAQAPHLGQRARRGAGDDGRRRAAPVAPGRVEDPPLRRGHGARVEDEHGPERAPGERRRSPPSSAASATSTASAKPALVEVGRAPRRAGGQVADPAARARPGPPAWPPGTVGARPARRAGPTRPRGCADELGQPTPASPIAPVRMTSRSTGAGARRRPRAGQDGDPELAHQLVHGGAR